MAKGLRRGWILVLTAVGLLMSGGATVAQDAPKEDYVKAHYTKFEYRIPMRDGKKLFTSVYVPKDTSQQYPFMITRTPYGVAPYGEGQYKKALGPSDEFEKAGYIFVYQDARGRFQSEGEFVEMHPHIDVKKSPTDVDDSSDMYDTIEFLLKNVPNNNGKVGIYGISYPGFYTSASIIDSHPAIKAASPQAPVTDLFMGDDSYHGGAFMLAATFEFYAGYFKPSRELWYPPAVYTGFDLGTPNGYDYFLKIGPTENLDTQVLKGSNYFFHDQLTHTTYDAFWKARDISQHLKNIHCAVLTVGGWFDAEDLSGPFKTFHAIEHFDPGIPNSLVVGPWTHGGWVRNDGSSLGDVQFGAKTSEYFRASIQLPFFEYYLKGKGAGLAKVMVFETGTNVWRTYDSWPPAKAQAKTLYLHAGGKLSFEPPAANEGSDEYVSVPAHPVPFVDYLATEIPQRYMTDDQRFASRRADVLTYETEPLSDDVTVSGPVNPKLKIASSGTDSDFVVKLIDVYPDDYPNNSSAPSVHMGGYEQLLRGEPMRAKFRNSWEKPEPLVPGKMAEVDFSMPDVNHTFRKGHRIMVQIQSSWFPLVDRNPQTFVEIPDAKPEDFKKATERVFHQKDAASGIELMVMQK
jgi:putative CocE/NonD family hydrolase